MFLRLPGLDLCHQKRVEIPDANSLVTLEIDGESVSELVTTFDPVGPFVVLL